MTNVLKKLPGFDKTEKGGQVLKNIKARVEGWKALSQETSFGTQSKLSPEQQRAAEASFATSMSGPTL